MSQSQSNALPCCSSQQSRPPVVELQPASQRRWVLCEPLVIERDKIDETDGIPWTNGTLCIDHSLPWYVLIVVETVWLLLRRWEMLEGHSDLSVYRQRRDSFPLDFWGTDLGHCAEVLVRPSE